MIKVRKVLSIFLIVSLFAGIFVGCNAQEAKVFQTMEDFQQARIGVLTGSAFDLLAAEHFPEAEKLYYINIADLILNLNQKKIDGILMDKGFFTPMLWEDNGLSTITMDMKPTEYAVAFPKTAESEPLRTQINQFIQTQSENGWLAVLEEKWFSSSEPNGNVDFSQLTGENGTLRVATTIESKPFDYLKNDQYCGYDAEFIFQFAREYGYALEIDTMDFGALLPSLTAGRYDLAISSITVTEERKESVLFSDTYCQSPIVMAVLSDTVSAVNTSGAAKQLSPKTLADLETATIGIVTGTSWDLVAQKQFPNAERKYFSSDADALLALSQGKVDVFLADRSVITAARWNKNMYTHINEPVGDISNAMIFAKEQYDEHLFAQFNTFISKSRTDGTLDRLERKWFSDREPEDHPDYTKLTGENGILRIATGDAMKPVAYMKDAMFTGYDIEFLTLFAQEYGYKLDIQGMSFDALIPSVASGKCDIGACGITITPERKESITFADPHFNSYGVAIVLDEAKESEIVLADFENATLGVFSGSSFDALAKERFPNAQRQYYTLVPDMILAVEQGKIDGYITETTYVTAAIWEGAKIKAVEEIIDRTSAGFIFRKDDSARELREQLNTFIRAAKENGTIVQLQEKWFAETEPTGKLDFDALTGENGTLRLGVAPDLKPISYIKDGEATGYEMELLLLFAKEYGYKLEMSYVTFDAILPGVTTGKYDIGTGAITITEERAQSVDFTDSHLTVDVVMVVKAESDSAAQTGFWDGLKEDFHKTFIREDRWKLIVKGIGVTMLISICSAVTGTLLGFGLYMLSRSDLKPLQALAKGFAKVYSRIIAGTPVVVILMILFYVVFGKFQDMSGVLVAIIGFTLTFGAFVYDHMTVSVGSVDHGQTEAAYALGYTKNKTFFRIIFPQAMTVFLPSYCGQAVDLIKATAVVGYIAVNDLTKMGDIIRSNTYEAFFPLIATAIIYFLLTWILSLLLGLVKKRFEPKRRKKEDILKGVKTV